MIQRILLATDGSAASERAADYVASIALRYKAGVTIVHAYVQGPPVSDGSNRPALYETVDEAKSLVKRVAKRLHDTGIEDITFEVLEGPAATVILGVADSQKIGMIVMGARGMSPWQGSLMGSVSMSVAQRAECPVLIVK